MRKYPAICFALVTAGCSATTTMHPVPLVNDSTATGLRFLKTQNVAIQVYEITAAKDETIVTRLGDVAVSSIPDPDALFEITFQGALFTSQSLNVKMSDKGTLKEIKLEKRGSEAAGAAAAGRGIAETIRDFEKTRMQAEIDNLNREVSLVRARKALQDALNQGKGQ